MRSRIALTARLLEQAVIVVSTHPGLFLVSGVLLVAKLLFLLLSAAAFVSLLLSQVIVTPPTLAAPGTCTFEWRLETIGQIQYAVLGVFLFWTVNFWLTAKFYIVAMTTGIWYFENESLAAQEGALTSKEHTRAPVMTSVKKAFTTGFGTIAFTSLVVTICDWLRQLARREARQDGLLGCLIACCIMCIVNCIEFLSRFALVYAALTGDNLCTSGRTFLDSCSRHGFLKVYVVDGLATITLQFGALVFSVLVSAIVVGLVNAGVLDGPQHNNERATVLGVAGGVAWLLAFFVLLFICSLLLYVVDAAYACIVIDLDNHARVGAFHRPQIAQAVLVKLNRPDFVVMQPAGGAAYAVAQPVAVAQPMARYPAP